jgi:hypothetical protein
MSKHARRRSRFSVLASLFVFMFLVLFMFVFDSGPTRTPNQELDIEPEHKNMKREHEPSSEK